MGNNSANIKRFLPREAFKDLTILFIHKDKKLIKYIDKK